MVGLINAAAIIQSCCDDPPVENFELTEMNISNFNPITLDKIEEGSGINYSEYSIRILFDIEILAQVTPSAGIYNSALAYDCDDDIIPQLNNRILDANIFATSDFDSTHPEGSPLNDLFEYHRVIKECVENGGAFEQCGENQSEFSFNNNLVDIINNSFSNNDYYNSLDTRFTYLNLAVLDAEPITSATQFILRLTFENGQVLSDTTEQVIFN
ncbi:hypothetical protein E1176_09460 [Fulvivirga sp. RKSG066]|uniref:hypothetical protein n=1 Tax=Fulvivirga aurantia TaxID=2529383 RepID=UPI0012BC28D2|nr:hypothetical protein [Fulvivirga aurantia]MTI21246.1 hypothetical protein [Fulvivirga aurantia]